MVFGDVILSAAANKKASHASVGEDVSIGSRRVTVKQAWGRGWRWIISAAIAASSPLMLLLTLLFFGFVLQFRFCDERVASYNTCISIPSFAAKTARAFWLISSVVRGYVFLSVE